MMIVKTLLYTGVRVSELINIKCLMLIYTTAKSGLISARGARATLSIPQSFKEMLAMHADSMKKKQVVYLFKSSWKKKYMDRGIRMILAKYSKEAGLVSPHKLRHFLLTCLKKEGHR